MQTVRRSEVVGTVHLIEQRTSPLLAHHAGKQVDGQRHGVGMADTELGTGGKAGWQWPTQLDLTGSGVDRGWAPSIRADPAAIDRGSPSTRDHPRRETSRRIAARRDGLLTVGLVNFASPTAIRSDAPLNASGIHTGAPPS